MLEQITNWEIDALATENEYQFETQLAREKGWCLNYTHEVVEEYKKFLYLCQVCDFGCVPSKAIDEAWHMHILRTTNYSKMCKDLFGKFLHHAPTASRQDQQLLEQQFERTLQAYEKTFGKTAPAQAWKEKGNGICCSEI